MVRQDVIRFRNKIIMNFRNGHFNSLYACGEFCSLLMIFANKLDLDQAWSGSKQFTTLIVFLKDVYDNVNFEKSQQTIKKSLPSMQRVNHSGGYRCIYGVQLMCSLTLMSSCLKVILFASFVLMIYIQVSNCSVASGHFIDLPGLKKYQTEDKVS